MAKLFPRRKLPSAPEGDALFELTWASFVDLAPHYIAGLPTQVNPGWATAKGVCALWVLLWGISEATKELERTSQGSTLRRLCERRLLRLSRQYAESVNLMCGALVSAARAAHRKADDGQVWMLVLEGFKKLVSDSRAELARLEPQK